VARRAIVLSIILYLITGAFWLPVVWMQMRMRKLAEQAVEAGAHCPRHTTSFFDCGSLSASPRSPPCSQFFDS